MCKQKREPADSGSDESTEDFYDAEILDEITTNRGEFKLRTVSFNEDRFSQVTGKCKVPFMLSKLFQCSMCIKLRYVIQIGLSRR